jgi:BlaI family transcriptional regulator, penicillinase repressor
MGDSTPTISEAEMAVLKVLWKHGQGSVRQIRGWLRGRKRPWAYNTVLTLLSRLRDKGYASSEKQGQAHVFQATVTREELLRLRLTQLADQVCDGTASPLVHALVQGQQFSPEEIAYFRRMLDELEPQE